MTPDWPGVEQAYRDSALTVVEIMALFGITQTQLYHRVRTEKWPQRRPRLPVIRRAPETDAPAGETLPPPDPTPDPSQDPSLAMLSRLIGALQTNIDDLEHCAKDPGRTDAERERDAKLLSTLAQVLDKLMALSERISQATPPDRDTAADHDRIVAAIAERVARLTAARSQGSLPPQPDGAGS